MAKFVRAKRNGFWDGQRRRNGAVFPVADNADENWFEAVGPAPAGTELPAQLLTAQAPPPRGFVQVMADLAKAGQEQRPKTLSEASSAVDDGASDLT